MRIFCWSPSNIDWFLDERWIFTRTLFESRRFPVWNFVTRTSISSWFGNKPKENIVRSNMRFVDLVFTVKYSPRLSVGSWRRRIVENHHVREFTTNRQICIWLRHEIQPKENHRRSQGQHHVRSSSLRSVRSGTLFWVRLFQEVGRRSFPSVVPRGGSALSEHPTGHDDRRQYVHAIGLETSTIRCVGRTESLREHRFELSCRSGRWCRNGPGRILFGWCGDFRTSQWLRCCTCESFFSRLFRARDIRFWQVQAETLPIQQRCFCAGVNLLQYLHLGQWISQCERTISFSLVRCDGEEDRNCNF